MATSLDPDISDADGWHRLADHRLGKMTEYQRRINAATRAAQGWRSRTLDSDQGRAVADAILAALHPVAASSGVEPKPQATEQRGSWPAWTRRPRTFSAASDGVQQ